MVVAACSGAPAEPDRALVDAVRRTAGTSFTFVARAELEGVSDDPAARQGMAILSSARIAGVLRGGDVRARVAALGRPFAELRVVSGTLHLRLQTGALAEITGGAVDPQRLLGRLRDARDLPEELRRVADALLRGDWVGIQGGLGPFNPLDLAAIPGTGGGGPTLDEDEVRAVGRAIRNRFGDLDRVVAELATVEEGDPPRAGLRLLAVSLDLHDGLRALHAAVREALGRPLPEEALQRILAGTPATVGGLRVTVADRLVTQVEADLTEMFSAGGARSGGTARLTVELSDHGQVPPVGAPEDAVTLTSGRLRELLEEAARGTDRRRPPNLAGDAVADVRRLAVAQEVVHAERGTYTERVGDLVEAGFVPARGGSYGACVYDGGQAYVVVATRPGAPAWYVDSRQGGPTDSPEDLGCIPELGG